jgi:hypothetical protein
MNGVQRYDKTVRAMKRNAEKPEVGLLELNSIR